MNNQQKLIAQIHSEFDSTQERLLREAEAIISNNHVPYSEFNKANRLAKIGFVNNKFVTDTQRRHGVVVRSLEEAELIKYYMQNYPFQKFLTEVELERICKKYNLIHMPVENYIGDVPEKNLIDIENAMPLDEYDIPEDKIWCELKRDNSFFLTSGDGGNWCGIWGSEWYRIPKRIEGRHFDSHFSADRYLHTQGFKTEYLFSEVTNFIEERKGLFICAPPSEFKGKNSKISFFVPEVKDPIVFRYVRGGIQVITKWGLEANDPALVVPKLN